MIVTVIIRHRHGLVPADTAQYGFEAVVNGQVILATDYADAEAKAKAREAELRNQHHAQDPS